MDAHCAAYRHAMAHVLLGLTDRYHTAFTPEEIRTVVGRRRRTLERSGKHAQFIPVLVEHAVRDEFAAMAAARGIMLSPLPKVLFVCEHNEGRSQLAAALAEHLSGGAVLARSAGLRPTGRLNPHAATVLAERGIDRAVPLPQEVQEDVLDAADVLVLIGCSTAPLMGRRTVQWDIDDPRARSLEETRRIVGEIETRVQIGRAHV